MKAAIFEDPGLENLRGGGQCQRTTVNRSSWCTYKSQSCQCKSHWQLNFEVSGALPKLIPLPNHIPGAELSGVVEEVGSHVNNLRKGERVIIHNKVFDGTCDMCLNGLDMICRNGGLISVITNGGFAEYISC